VENVVLQMWIVPVDLQVVRAGVLYHDFRSLRQHSEMCWPSAGPSAVS